LKKFRKILGLLIVGVIGVSVAGCSMIQKTPEAIKKTVVAKVGSEKITLGDVDQQIQSVITQLKEQYGDDYESNETAKSTLTEQRKSALEQLVQQKILLNKANELGVAPTEDELNKVVDEQLEQYKEVYGGEDKLNEALTAYGLDMDALKKMIKENETMNKVYDEMTKDATVTEDDAKVYYEANKATYTQGAGATVAHILAKFNDASTEATAEEDSKAKAKIDEIKSKLNGGANFEELAKAESDDTGSATSGGSLGHIDYSSTQYVKEFMDGFKNLKEGEVSAPVKSQFGYHIIKVTDVQSEDKVQEFDTVKDKITETLTQQKQNEAYNSKLEEWKKELNVKTYEDKL